MAINWGYEGKRVIVSGGAVRDGCSRRRRPLDLGAEVHVLDIKEPSVRCGVLPDRPSST